MKSWKFTLIAFCMALACNVTSSPAQEKEGAATEEKKGILQGLMDTLGEAAKESLKEKVDELAGTYKGQLGEVRLVERRGNAVVLEVAYENVKRSDGVYVQGEVLSGGVALEGFPNTLTPVGSRHGRVRLTISRSVAQDEGWGLPPADTASDQISLFLMRETHPDRRFGSIVYDLAKTWTDSDAPDELPPSDAEGIELAEGEELEGADSASTPVTAVRPFVSAGTVLFPRTKTTQKAAQLTVTAPSKSQSHQGTPVPPVRAASLTLTSYNFYDKAGMAAWKSAAGLLPFPGKANDRRGFACCIKRGQINPGLNAINMLETHPQWTSKGWIEGRYPSMVLGKKLHFKAVAGFLKGAGNSDGARFRVYIYEKGRHYRVLSQRVLPAKHVNLEADLSRWSGKKVQIILRVDAGKSSSQDWAVWVNPRVVQ